MSKVAYKLIRVRKDGTLGPLFIGRSLVIPIGKWLKAKAIRTKGFAFRPGWHCCSKPEAPHLSKVGRTWARIQIKGIKKHQRPMSQGGLWYTAKWMKIEELFLWPTPQG